MGKYITKAIAEEAAAKMAQKAFNEKIRKASDELEAKADELAKKHVPGPVLSLISEYAEYFYQSNGVTFVPHGTESLYHLHIRCHTSFTMPSANSRVEITQEEGADISKLHKALRDLEAQKSDCELRISRALLTLRTKNNVEKEFPEALEYLDLPSVADVPAPMYQELRNLFKKAE